MASQSLVFETDDFEEFKHMLKSFLPVGFSPGRNEKPQFHNMYYDLSKSPRYWCTIKDSKDDGPLRKCVIALTNHLSEPNNSDEIPIKMEFITHGEHEMLTWADESYKKVYDKAINAIISNTVEREGFCGPDVKGLDVNGWVESESRISGSSTMSYKMEFKESSPDCLYISLGYMYLGQ